MFGELDLSLIELALCCAAAAAGGAVQGVLGFGYALLVVPGLLIVAPLAVPATALTVALPMVVVLALIDPSSIERSTVARLTIARLPGTVLGAVVLALVAPKVLGGVTGAFLLLAVAGSAMRGRRRASSGLEYGAGFLSGLAGTVGAVGGPYIGLVLADRPGPILRATVSAAYAFGILLSLVAVAAEGGLTGSSLALGAVLVPATFAGLPFGRHFAERLDGALLRAAVLWVAGGAGLFAVVRALA